jgi:hypothetical protein
MKSVELLGVFLPALFFLFTGEISKEVCSVHNNSSICTNHKAFVFDGTKYFSSTEHIEAFLQTSDRYGNLHLVEHTAESHIYLVSFHRDMGSVECTHGVDLSLQLSNLSVLSGELILEIKNYLSAVFGGFFFLLFELVEVIETSQLIFIFLG